MAHDHHQVGSQACDGIQDTLGMRGGGGINTSQRNHPLFLERAGDFDEDMQEIFFETMSHMILQSVAYYSPNSSSDANDEPVD